MREDILDVVQDLADYFCVTIENARYFKELVILYILSVNTETTYEEVEREYEILLKEGLFNDFVTSNTNSSRVNNLSLYPK